MKPNDDENVQPFGAEPEAPTWPHWSAIKIGTPRGGQTRLAGIHLSGIEDALLGRSTPAPLPQRPASLRAAFQILERAARNYKGRPRSIVHDRAVKPTFEERLRRGLRMAAHDVRPPKASKHDSGGGYFHEQLGARVAPSGGFLVVPDVPWREFRFSDDPEKESIRLTPRLSVRQGVKCHVTGNHMLIER